MSPSNPLPRPERTAGKDGRPRTAFAIGPRTAAHRYLDGDGGGQADHVRRINHRLYFFAWSWNADGAKSLTVRALLPNPCGVPGPWWTTLHEFTNV